MDQNTIQIVLYIVLPLIGAIVMAILKPTFEFIQKFVNKKEQNDSCQFVLKETYSKDRATLYDIFLQIKDYNRDREENKETLRELKKEVKDVSNGITDIKQNQAIQNTHIEYIKDTLDKLPKRNTDDVK